MTTKHSLEIIGHELVEDGVIERTRSKSVYESATRISVKKDGEYIHVSSCPLALESAFGAGILNSHSIRLSTEAARHLAGLLTKASEAAGDLA